MIGETEITAPSAEPISTAGAKTHLRITTSDDDTYIDALVVSARKYAEAVRGESFIDTTWRHDVAAFPSTDYIELPRRPLSSVTTVEYRKDGSESFTTFAPASNYRVATSYQRGRVELISGISWPSDSLESGLSVRVTYVAGYGSAGSNVPQNILQAMYLLVGHWYENREALQGASNLPRPIEFAVGALLGVDRVRSF